MSSKSAKKAKKVPRTLQEIQQSYQELCFKAGQIQYQIKVLGDELAGVNRELLEANREAAARKEIDAAQAAPKTEVTNEQQT